MASTSGTVGLLQQTVEGDETVLRFRLRTPEGTVVAVELRGHAIQGGLEQGDEVSFSTSGDSVLGDDGTARPRVVANETTGATIEVRRRGAGRKAARRIGDAAVSTAFGIGGAFFSALLIQSDSGAVDAVAGGAPGTYSEPNGLAALLIGLVVAVGVFALLGWRRRGSR